MAAGLSSPTSLEIAPDGRVFVCQQDGTIRIIKNNALLGSPFATLAVDATGERGLLGVALDPGFANNQYVYVYYTARLPTSHNRLSRLTANGDTAVAGSEVILLELPDVGSAIWHMGGAIHFGIDQTIFLSIGDYQNPASAQSLNVLTGKILRLNKDGTIPADNPFYTQASGINRAIWAMGLRNPFTTAVQPGTGRFYINDVGETSWEEINSGSPGANFGWPLTEGDFDQATYPDFTRPIYSYPDWTSACAITGGAFYNPATTQFPAQYVGKYFFQDFCAGTIQVLDPVTLAVTNFSEGASYPTDLRIAPDGSLYYLARGAATGGQAVGLGSVHKIQYVLSTPPTVTLQPQNQFVYLGQSATFTVSAIGTPPLSYQWQRNGANITGATSSSYTISSTAPGDNGVLFRCVVNNAYGTATSSNALLTVTNNRPPVATITAPVTGSRYNAGDTIAFAGYGTDSETGALPATNLTWQIDFQHDQHAHPFYPPTSGITNGTFTIPTTGETSTNVFYRIYLTVRDPVGFTHTATRDILPNTASILLNTSPAGLQIQLDGQPHATPLNVGGVVGITRSLGTFVQVTNGITYTFDHWSDGGGATHSISFPPTNTTYTAFYRVVVASNDLVGWYKFDEGSGSSVADSSPSANHGSLQNGPGWTTGKLGSALSFDGINDFVSLGTPLSSWLGGSASLTAWIRTTQVGDNTVWLAPGLTGVEQATALNDVFWGWLDASGRIGISAGNGTAAKSTQPVNNGQWHHVGLTRDASSGEVKVYVDGLLNSTAISDTGIKTTSFASLGRIEDTAGTPAYFAGSMDDVRLYASVLGSADIQAIANTAPLVNAGTNRTIALPASANLAGTVSDDGLPNPPAAVTVTWRKVTGPGTVTFGNPNTTNTTAGFNLPGVYVLSLTASDGALSSSNVVTVTVNDTYSAWAIRYGVGDELADDDGDTLSNLLEYGLGLNPTVPDHSVGPKAALEANHLILTYTRVKAATDLTFTLEASSNIMGAWSSSGVSSQIISEDATRQTIKATDAASTSGTASRFLRLKVTRQ